MQNENSYNRYQRQIILKELGSDGQQKLFKAKVLVVGAGGLGCPALQYLTAAGVGTIGVVDFDIIELSNLQRQTLYNIDDIGKHKAITAIQKLQAFNPEINFITHCLKLTNTNALSIIANYDVVLDGTDNFATRYLINDACAILNKPLIYGAILRFEGQVGVFNCLDKEKNLQTNYRDLFPEPPNPSEVLSCNEAGVLGVLPGIIGTLQTTEVIKIITEIGKPLYNKILSYNVLNNLFYEFDVSINKNNRAIIPQTKTEFENFNYDWFCGIKKQPNEISINDFETLRVNENITIIDVREYDEMPVVVEFEHIQIPLSLFENEISNQTLTNKIVVFCQSGKRSLQALKIIQEKSTAIQVFSLQGGIEAWKKHQLKNLINQ